MNSPSRNSCLAATMLSLALSSASASAQEEAEVMPAPRLPDGSINLGLAPGYKGFWGSSGNIFGQGRLRHPGNPTVDEIPFQPWARALFDFREANLHADDPHSRCVPAGPVRQVTTVNGFEIIQQPELDRVTFIFGGGVHTWRHIPLDGRPLPDVDDPDLIPTYMGYPTGHWEGDTLVVESTGFSENTWFAAGGLPHTRFLKLTEKFSRPDFETLSVEVTVDDPGAYTAPWTGGFDVKWNWTSWDGSEAGELHEYFCQDNNLDSQHMVGDQ